MAAFIQLTDLQSQRTVFVNAEQVLFFGASDPPPGTEIYVALGGTLAKRVVVEDVSEVARRWGSTVGVMTFGTPGG